MIETIDKKIQTAAYTVVTPSYIAHALSLRKSFLQHNIDAEFYIGILGNKEHCPQMNLDNFYFLNSLSDNRLDGMKQRYGAFEMTCALKPFFAAHIFEIQPHIQRLIYLDSDMYVFGSFLPKTKAAITISPHRTKNTAYLPESKNYSIISLNRYGVFNAGYFELQRKKEAFAFLDWWMNLMEYTGFDKPDENQFGDQIWLNVVPAFFDDYFINKDPGYNVAIWNLIERDVKERNGNYYVNDQPLVLFHYSKYNTAEPDEMVNYKEPYLTFANFPVLKGVYQKYREGLFESGYEQFKSLPYPFLKENRDRKKLWWKKLFS